MDTWVVFYSLAIVDNAAKNTDIQISKSPLSLLKKKSKFMQKKSAMNKLSKSERRDQEQHSAELQESRRRREGSLTLTLYDPARGAP